MPPKTAPTPRKPRKSSSRPPKPSSARKAPASTAETYWQAVRKPVYALVFTLPMMLLYELGVILWGADDARRAFAESHQRYGGEVLRNGTDAFIRSHLQWLADYFGWSGLFLSGSVIVLTLVLWQLLSRSSWTVRFDHVVGMTGESVLYASILPLSYVLFNLTPLAGSISFPSQACANIFFDLGTGVYEEFVFRLVLLGLIYLFLTRLVELDATPAGIVACLSSALVFATAHHLGNLGEPFAWTTFLKHAVLGIFFGAIFIARGFGIAAGTHVFHNILVNMVIVNNSN